MGGARLKSKYQTKEVYRAQKDQLPNVIHTEKKKKSPKRNSPPKSNLSPSKKSSVSSSMRKPPRRNIKQKLREADIERAHMRKENNQLLKNMDSWALVRQMTNQRQSRPMRPYSGAK